MNKVGSSAISFTEGSLPPGDESERAALGPPARAESSKGIGARLQALQIGAWQSIGTRFLPFADAASQELPLARLLRLSLFQITVGMSLALLVGTLNRVMIVELSVSAWLVSLMVSLPILFAPFRAFIGFRSDTYRSVLGWKRVPFIWFGTLLQFGGLAIMPFALVLLSGDSQGHPVVGHVGAALAFLLVGAGIHTTQTAGLALATDLAPSSSRPRVVALLYVMLLVGTVIGSVVFSALLDKFSQIRLIQVIQGAAVVTIVLNVFALWKQEPRHRVADSPDKAVRFTAAWKTFRKTPDALRLLVAIGLGTAAFNMQDIILEPYGAEVLKLSVSSTSLLTALLAGGALLSFGFASHQLGQSRDPFRLASVGVFCGILGFCAVIFSAPLTSTPLFHVGVIAIGFGGGLFAVCTLTATMALDAVGLTGLAVGAWGAVQATAAGVAISVGGAIRDVVSHLAVAGQLGEALSEAVVGYSAVYHLEILLLFMTLIALGPLARFRKEKGASTAKDGRHRIGLADLPS